MKQRILYMLFANILTNLFTYAATELPVVDSYHDKITTNAIADVQFIA